MAIWLKILLGGGIGVAAGGLLGYFGKCSSGACPLTANPYRGALIGAILGVSLALATATGGCKATEEKPQQEASAVKHLHTEDEFASQVLKADKPVLVDFHTEGCAFCEAQAPTIRKLAAEYKGRADVVKLDGEKLPGLRDTYDVHGYPTVLVFSGGQVVGRFIGFRSERQDAPNYRAALDAAIK